MFQVQFASHRKHCFSTSCENHTKHISTLCMHIVTTALSNSYGDMSVYQAGRTSWPRLAAAQLSRANVTRASLNLPDFLFCSACRKWHWPIETDSFCRQLIASYAYGFVRRAVLDRQLQELERRIVVVVVVVVVVIIIIRRSTKKKMDRR